MKRGIRRLLCLAALVILAALPAACTVLIIRGNSNSVTDSGGHGGGLSLDSGLHLPTHKQRLEHQGQPTGGNQQ
jgi:hypothetical protein